MTIEALNDSRQIGLCVYNVMIMSTVGVPLVSLLSIQQVSIAYGVCALAISLSATTTLILVFGSKVQQHYDSLLIIMLQYVIMSFLRVH